MSYPNEILEDLYAIGNKSLNLLRDPDSADPKLTTMVPSKHLEANALFWYLQHQLVVLPECAYNAICDGLYYYQGDPTSRQLKSGNDLDYFFQTLKHMFLAKGMDTI